MKNSFYKTYAKNGVCFYKNKLLDSVGFINHAFSTRIGGVSTNAYSSLNLGVNTNDIKENVFKNFELFADAIGSETNKMVLAQQVHSPNLRIVSKDDIGKGIVKKTDIEETDGLITNEKNVMLCSFYADCTPFLMVDTKNKVVASVHSGWRGTLLKIAYRTVLKMKDEFNTSPEDLLCVTGPSIKQKNFEVGEEVYREFYSEFGTLAKKNTFCKNNKFYIDTDSINKSVLESLGILSNNIDICPICTYENAPMFFSHRASGGNTGRMCAVIELL